MVYSTCCCLQAKSQKASSPFEVEATLAVAQDIHSMLSAVQRLVRQKNWLGADHVGLMIAASGSLKSE